MNKQNSHPTSLRNRACNAPVFSTIESLKQKPIGFFPMNRQGRLVAQTGSSPIAHPRRTLHFQRTMSTCKILPPRLRGRPNSIVRK
jgi:hypothetical protein